MTVPLYYKSRFLDTPIVYVEDAHGWRSYAPGGVIGEHRGSIPESVVMHVEPIDQKKAQSLIEERLEEAHRIKAQRTADEMGEGALAQADYDGTKKLWGILPSWALIPIAVGVLLDTLGAAYRIYWVGSIGAVIWVATWLRVRQPTNRTVRFLTSPRKKDDPL